MSVEATPAEFGLGRELREWHGKAFLKAFFYLCVVFAGVSVIGMLAVLVLLPAENGRDIALTLLTGMLVMSVIFGLALLDRAVSIFRVHEFGVSKRSPIANRALRFDQVTSFTFQVMRLYVQGIYTTTNYLVKFEGDSPAGRQKIAWAMAIRGEDQDMHWLRDHASRHIASQMASELQTQGVIPWTPRLSLTTQAIIDRKGREIPFSEISNISLDGGQFKVFVAGANRPLLNEATNTANFFPGLQVLESLLDTGASEAEVGQPPAAPAASEQGGATPPPLSAPAPPSGPPASSRAHAAGAFSVALFGMLALFLTVGGMGIVLWQTLKSEQAGIDALEVFLFPAFGALVSFVVAFVLHRVERSRARLWEMNPVIANSRFSQPPDADRWARWKLVLPSGLFIVLAVIPEVLILTFAVGA